MLLILIFYKKLLKAQESLRLSSMKLDLLKKSLEMRIAELPEDSKASIQLREELANANSYSPACVHYTSLQPFRDVSNNNKNHISSSTFSRCAAVTGEIFFSFRYCTFKLYTFSRKSYTL